jgi:exodeoxyribonuclease VII large subunit
MASGNAPEFSVSELSQALKRSVEDAFGHVRVRGELSGVKRAASGHLYLALKDESALLDGVMWKGVAGALPFRPEDGIEVVATGKLTTYPGRSKYQIVIERMELAGAGALLQMLELLKRRLAAEGLFAPERKRAIPYLPEVIGVVTSPTGAVIRDILHRLADRFPRHVLVWPVLVQGEGAARQVAAAVRGFNAPGPFPKPDLLIVARGGGSVEDLMAFNDEDVVRAVAASDIPVISAVGHETDTTLCDFAADLRAPTPTAAAERAVPVREDLLLSVRDLGLRMDRAVTKLARERAERVAAIAARLPSPRAILALKQQRADDLGFRLPRALEANAAQHRLRFRQTAALLRPAVLVQRRDRAGEALARLGAAVDPARALADIRRRREPFDALERLRVSLSYRSTLARGYAVVRSGDRVLTSAAAARVAGTVEIEFADGQVEAVTGGSGRTTKPRAAAPKQESLF